MPKPGTHKTFRLNIQEAKRIKHNSGSDSHGSLLELMSACEHCFNQESIARTANHIENHLTAPERRARWMFMRGW